MKTNRIDRQNNRFEAVIHFFRESRRFLVMSHANPDGDAVGSLLGLGLGLKALGKDATLFCEGASGEMFAFLPGFPEIAADPGDRKAYDVVVLLDCRELERVSASFKPAEDDPPLVILDHHLNHGAPPANAVIDSKASATGELVFYLLEALGAPVTPEIAANLYTAISTDTGSFSFENTSPESLRVAAELVEAGARPWDIYCRLNMGRSPERLRLLGLALQNLEFYHDGRVGVLAISREMMSQSGASAQDTDGFVEFPRSVKGVELAALIREDKSGRYKISMRSLGRVNAADLANRFGGGGHFQAAGFSLEGSLDEVKARFSEAVADYLPGAAPDQSVD